MSTAKQRKRYRLHQKIKKHFKYNAHQHTIYVPCDFKEKEYPEKTLRALGELLKLNYSLQTEIQ